MYFKSGVKNSKSPYSMVDCQHIRSKVGSQEITLCFRKMRINIRRNKS